MYTRRIKLVYLRNIKIHKQTDDRVMRKTSFRTVSLAIIQDSDQPTICIRKAESGAFVKFNMQYVLRLRNVPKGFIAPGN